MSLKIGLFFILCLTVLLALTNGERVRYDNYRVYKVNASTREELALLKQMEDTDNSLIFLDGIGKMNRAITVVVPPQKVSDFLLVLDKNNIEYNLVEKNLQKAVDIDYQQVAPRFTINLWSSYQKLTYNYMWMQRLPTSYPGNVTLIEAGKSYEKRSILGVKISLQNGIKQKPAIFVEAGIHAREWISPATATYIIRSLLTSTDEEVRELAENYEWYIIPHANPDGYVYTHSTDRMWRKTRKPYDDCVGADPNRNFNVSWNTIGASSDPCSITYAGSAANSELEVKSLSNYIDSLKHEIKLYLSLHSYSQLLMYPFGDTPDLPENVKDFEQVFNVTIDAISKRHGTIYTGGNIYDAIYPAAGSSVDYAYSKAGIRMAFCFELRPNSSFDGNGMELPADEIIPTAEETLDGLVAMVNEVKVLGYFD